MGSEWKEVPLSELYEFRSGGYPNLVRSLALAIHFFRLRRFFTIFLFQKS